LIPEGSGFSPGALAGMSQRSSSVDPSDSEGSPQFGGTFSTFASTDAMTGGLASPGMQKMRVPNVNDVSADDLEPHRGDSMRNRFPGSPGQQPSPSGNSVGLQDEDGDLADAATKIQAIFRGKNQRRNSVIRVRSGSEDSTCRDEDLRKEVESLRTQVKELTAAMTSTVAETPGLRTALSAAHQELAEVREELLRIKAEKATSASRQREEDQKELREVVAAQQEELSRLRASEAEARDELARVHEQLLLHQHSEGRGLKAEINKAVEAERHRHTEAARSALARWRNSRQVSKGSRKAEVDGPAEQERRRNAETIAALEAALTAFEEDQKRQAEVQLTLAGNLEDELHQREGEWRESLQRLSGRGGDRATPPAATASCTP